MKTDLGIPSHYTIALDLDFLKFFSLKRFLVSYLFGCSWLGMVCSHGLTKYQGEKSEDAPRSGLRQNKVLTSLVMGQNPAGHIQTTYQHFKSKHLSFVHGKKIAKNNSY